jgi:hypothetical protein
VTSQARVVAWGRSTFGESFVTDVPERALRATEEVLELAQACGLDAATLHRLVDYVFARPVGEASQEIGGCMVTLYATALALGVDADAALETELARIQQPEVVERCRRRQDEKRAALVTGDTTAAR